MIHTDTDKPKLSADGTPHAQHIMNIAVLAGMLILENGGETFRAEETVRRICAAGGYVKSEVIALPTGLFLSLISESPEGEDKNMGSLVRRVQKRTVNLYKIERTNAVSRAFESGKLMYGEAYAALTELSAGAEPLGKPLRGFIAGASAGLFTLLYGGSLFDASVSVACGFTVQYLSSSFRRSDVHRFAISLIGSIIIASTAIATRRLFDMGDINRIIIGGIMPLLPGLALTNAIRDTIMGDLVSGVSRFAEVLLTAFAIAGGVGAVFAFYIWTGGTL